jgi:hypothetical protein
MLTVASLVWEYPWPAYADFTGIAKDSPGQSRVGTRLCSGSMTCAVVFRAVEAQSSASGKPRPRTLIRLKSAKSIRVVS